MNANKYQDEAIALPASVMTGKIGIVTVTYNSELMLGDFLTSIAQQSYRSFVLFAIDNASKDNTLALLEANRSEHLIVIANHENLGVAAGNNQGIRAAIEAKCEYVMLLNNDVVLDSEMIARLVSGMRENPCSMAVPMMYFQEPSNRIWAAGGQFRANSGFRVHHRHAYEKDSPQSGQTCRIDYAPTCCVLIKREVFGEIGLMDERYFVYSDDADFMYRARMSGITMFFIPSAKLWHKVNALTGGAESDFSYFYGARGRALFLYKHLDAVSASFWILLHASFDALRAVFRKNFRHPCKLKWRGMKEGRKVALGS